MTPTIQLSSYLSLGSSGRAKPTSWVPKSDNRIALPTYTLGRIVFTHRVLGEVGFLISNLPALHPQAQCLCGNPEPQEVHMTDEMIPDALPEGFGDDVEVSAEAPHPNKRRKRVHMLEMWHDLHKDLPSMGLITPMVPLGPEDMAIFAAGLSTLWCEVHNGNVGFDKYDNPEEIARQVKMRCKDTLRKILHLADPTMLPGSDFGGDDDE